MNVRIPLRERSVSVYFIIYFSRAAFLVHLRCRQKARDFNLTGFAKIAESIPKPQFVIRYSITIYLSPQVATQYSCPLSNLLSHRATSSGPSLSKSIDQLYCPQSVDVIASLTSRTATSTSFNRYRASSLLNAPLRPVNHVENHAPYKTTLHLPVSKHHSSTADPPPPLPYWEAPLQRLPVPREYTPETSYAGVLIMEFLPPIQCHDIVSCYFDSPTLSYHPRDP